MSELNFIITKQKLIEDGEPFVVADSHEYLTAKFNFSNDWNNCSKTAIFKASTGDAYSVLPDSENSCTVPWEVIEFPSFSVSVYGVHGNERITTNTVTVRVSASGYEEGETPEPPSPTVYEQIVNKLNDVEDELDGLGTAADCDTGTDEGDVPILGANGKLPVSTIPPEAFDAVQSDWDEDSPQKLSFIKNKPSALSDFTDDLGNSPVHSHSQYLTAETDPTVPSWAKEDTKPTYDYSEIENTPTIPTNLTDLAGTLPITQGGTGAANVHDAQKNLGFLKRYTSLDHLTLPASYTIADIFGAMADNTIIELDITTIDTSLFPHDIGVTRLFKITSERGYGEYRCIVDAETTGNWVSYYKNDVGFSGWRKNYTDMDVVPVTNGGTGATTADNARLNLGAQATLTAGANIQLNGDTISATDTTYSPATSSADGLMSSADKSKLDGVESGAEVNVQSDWSQSDNSADDFIKNKPTALSDFTDDLGNSPVHSHSQYLTEETDPTVPSWAKEDTKPTYDYSEIENTPTIPTNLTDLAGVLPINQGGTGATDFYTAQSNLGLMKRYKNLTHLNLPSGYTIADIFAAMGNNTYIELDISTMDISLFPWNQGVAKFVRITSNRAFAEYKCTINNGIAGSWVGYYHSNTSFSGWIKLYSGIDVIPIANGGTGASTYNDAQSAFHFYTELSQIGITAPCTTADVISALPIRSILIVGTESSLATITDAPTGYGIFTFFKGANPNRKLGLFARSLVNTADYETGNWFYIMNIANNVYTWQKILTNVATDNTLLTTNKTIVGAINELYGMIQTP